MNTSCKYILKYDISTDDRFYSTEGEWFLHVNYEPINVNIISWNTSILLILN